MFFHGSFRSQEELDLEIKQKAEKGNDAFLVNVAWLIERGGEEK